MVLKMIGFFGEPDITVYYKRVSGDMHFFVPDREDATELSLEECKDLLKNAMWFLKLNGGMLLNAED